MNGVRKFEHCGRTPTRCFFQNVAADRNDFESRGWRKEGLVCLLDRRILIFERLDQYFGQRKFTIDKGFRRSNSPGGFG